MKHLIEAFAEEAVVVFELAERTAQAAREATNLAMAMGTTAQEIQRLEYAAKFAGVQAEVLHMALRRLSTSAVDASKGGAESNLIFSQLGINIFDSAGKIKNSTSLLKDIAEVFHTMPDGVLKTDAAVKLFGRSGPDWIPVLNKGREGLKELGDEGERVGYVMTELQDKQGKKFTENLHEIEATVQGITRSIGVRLIPVFIDLMEKLKDWYTVNKDLINQNVTQFVYTMAHSLEMLWSFLDAAFKAIKFLTGGLGGLKEILIVVVALFAAFTVGSTVFAIGKMVKIVWELVEALKAAALWEAITTGGFSLVAGLAAGAAVIGLGAYAAYGDSGPPLNTIRNSGPDSSYSSAGTRPTNWNAAPSSIVNAKFEIHSSGTTEAQKTEIAHHVKRELGNVMRTTASAATLQTPGGL